MSLGAKLIAFLKVALAMILGGIIGAEREMEAKPAGLRTHMCVAGAACLLVSPGEFTIQYFSRSSALGFLRADPVRIIEAIITGISFLGAGTTIFRKEEKRIDGLTTAATVLLTAGIGIAVGINAIALGSGVTVLGLVALRGIDRFERRIHAKDLKKSKHGQS